MMFLASLRLGNVVYIYSNDAISSLWIKQYNNLVELRESVPIYSPLLLYGILPHGGSASDGNSKPPVCGCRVSPFFSFPEQWKFHKVVYLYPKFSGYLSLLDSSWRPGAAGPRVRWLTSKYH